MSLVVANAMSSRHQRAVQRAMPRVWSVVQAARKAPWFARCARGARLFRRHSAWGWLLPALMAGVCVPVPLASAGPPLSAATPLPAAAAAQTAAAADSSAAVNSALDTSAPAAGSAPAGAALQRVTVREAGEQVQRTGRILVEAQDGGLLLEERSGRILQLTPDLLLSREQLPEPFTHLPADAQAEYLQQLLGGDCHVHIAEHYLICSAAAPAYSEFCAALLEQVYREYFEFFSDFPELQLTPPDAPLPVIIFRTAAEFQEFAQQQHPETSFDETPGFYSVRDNLVLLLDLTADPGIATPAAVRRRLVSLPRQAATIVHEAVHQLAFNSGLQIRMADNPLWLSEGLAAWFEPVSVRSPLLWSRPGLVNPVYQPALARLPAGAELPVPLSELLRSDQPFLEADRVAQAYAVSWGLMAYLARQERAGLDRLLKSVSQRKPLRPLTADERLQEFEVAIGKSADEIQRAMIPYVSRLRVSR